MIQYFQNSLFDSLFNTNNNISSSIQSKSKVEKFKIETKMKLPETKPKDNFAFTFFGMKKNNPVRDLKATPVLKSKPKVQNDLSYYPHSGMGLFFV